MQTSKHAVNTFSNLASLVMCSKVSSIVWKVPVEHELDYALCLINHIGICNLIWTRSAALGDMVVMQAHPAPRFYFHLSHINISFLRLQYWCSSIRYCTNNSLIHSTSSSRNYLSSISSDTENSFLLFVIVLRQEPSPVTTDTSWGSAEVKRKPNRGNLTILVLKFNYFFSGRTAEKNGFWNEK